MQHINVLNHLKKNTLQAKSYHEILFGSDDYYQLYIRFYKTSPTTKKLPVTRIKSFSLALDFATPNASLG